MSRRAVVDPAGGSGGDSYTLAIARDEQRSDDAVVVLELIRETKPPFSPEAVTADYAKVVRAYGLTEVTGDRYAGEWPREQFRKHGVEYQPSAKSKSDIYAAFLPLLNSGRVELLDHPRLLAQLARLERRTARGGRDTIDHAPSGHDDVANAAAGALVLVSEEIAGGEWRLLFGKAWREQAQQRPAEADAKTEASEQAEQERFLPRAERERRDSSRVERIARMVGCWMPGDR